MRWLISEGQLIGMVLEISARRELDGKIRCLFIVESRTQVMERGRKHGFYVLLVDMFFPSASTVGNTMFVNRKRRVVTFELG